MEPHPDRKTALAPIFFALFFLFFLQLLTAFIEATYTFGLLSTSLPPEVASVVLFFTPFLLLPFRRGLPRRVLLFLALLALVCRAALPLLNPAGKMLVAGLGTGNFLLFLPAWLSHPAGGLIAKSDRSMGLGLALSVAGMILFKAVNSGVDISLQPITGIALALVGAALLPTAITEGERLPETEAEKRPSASFGRVTGLSLGITGTLALVYFAFASPNVIARWTGAPYLAVLSACLFALTVYAGLHAGGWLWQKLSLPVLLVWNGVFTAALTLTILAHQVDFPADPGAYPLAEGVVPAWANAALYLALLTFPVLLADFTLFVSALGGGRVSPQVMGAGFGLAALFLLALIFGHVFTTVYDYIPVVGPPFRNRFWLVHFIAALAAGLPIFLLGRAARARLVSSSSPGNPWLWLTAVGLIGAVALGCASLRSLNLGYLTLDSDLRVMTYNVQQGYSETGEKNYAGQLAVIRAQNPDIVTLQESDTNRPAGGNEDLVRYFADALGMHAYYGPKTVTGTFGIALLSHYLLQDAQTVYLFSEGSKPRPAWPASRWTVSGST